MQQKKEQPGNIDEVEDEFKGLQPRHRDLSENQPITGGEWICSFAARLSLCLSDL